MENVLLSGMYLNTFAAAYVESFYTTYNLKSF